MNAIYKSIPTDDEPSWLKPAFISISWLAGWLTTLLVISVVLL
jgi:hypothetical protein